MGEGKKCEACDKVEATQEMYEFGRCADHRAKVYLADLKAAIKRDLELIHAEALRLEEMARKAAAVAAMAKARLEANESIGTLPCVCASDLDMQASRVARRVDHMQALVEVAYVAEGGTL